jgi:hypothetical protein
MSSNYRSLFGSNTELLPMLTRLKGITGFATTLTTRRDHRALVFNRFNHVSRVATLAAFIANSLEIPTKPVLRIAWLHDLNRWPFAHNSERDIFSQADDAEAYFAQLIPAIAESEVADLVALQRRNIGALSISGLVTMVADAVTGAIEDPLLLICGLNVHPNIVPKEISDLLGTQFQSKVFAQHLEVATRLLLDDRNGSRFGGHFDELFLITFQNFLLEHNVVSNGALNSTDAFHACKLINHEFMQPIVFPINNDLVCHASWLRMNVIHPLLRDSDSRIVRSMLSLNETSFVKQVLKSREFRDLRAKDFLPSIDAIEEHYPELAFISV